MLIFIFEGKSPNILISERLIVSKKEVNISDKNLTILCVTFPKPELNDLNINAVFENLKKILNSYQGSRFI